MAIFPVLHTVYEDTQQQSIDVRENSDINAFAVIPSSD